MTVLERLTQRSCGGGPNCDLTYTHTHKVEPGSEEEIKQIELVSAELEREIENHEQSAKFHKERVEALREDLHKVIERRQQICKHPNGFPGFLIGICPLCGLDDY